MCPGRHIDISWGELYLSSSVVKETTTHNRKCDKKLFYLNTIQHLFHFVGLEDHFDHLSEIPKHVAFLRIDFTSHHFVNAKWFGSTHIILWPLYHHHHHSDSELSTLFARVFASVRIPRVSRHALTHARKTTAVDEEKQLARVGIKPSKGWLQCWHCVDGLLTSHL